MSEKRSQNGVEILKNAVTFNARAVSQLTHWQWKKFYLHDWNDTNNAFPIPQGCHNSGYMSSMSV
jgi:hypothetical protein